MGLIYSSVATRDFTGNPLEVPLRVGGEDGNWNRQFGPFSLKGLAGLMGMGMGLGGMAKADAIAAIAAGAKPGSEAYEAYYGATGYYSQGASVIRGVEETAARREPLGEQPAPMLYGAKPCGAAEMGSTDCVSYNMQVQQANMALQENARRAWNLTVCEHNAAVNPGANDMPCGQYKDRLPVPAVPGNPVLQQAVCTEGECYTPFIGGTDTRVATRPVVPVAPLTQQQIASYTQNKPNQTVPPKEQPGEVPVKTAAELAAEKLAAEKLAAGGADDGKIFGMDPVMLAVIAGVGALLLLKE